MKMEDFTKDLPDETKCDRCSRKLSSLNWAIGRFGASDWMGMCIVKCTKCSWTRVAAAGSSEDAHKRAQMMRWDLIAALGIHRPGTA